MSTDTKGAYATTVGVNVALWSTDNEGAHATTVGVRQCLPMHEY